MLQREQRYVSTELSHFVGRGLQENEQFELLIKSIREGWITHPPHNPNVSGNLSVKTDAPFSSNGMYSPEIVCFCDIPIPDLKIHTEKYSGFGLSFNKEFIVKQGGRPVLYLPHDSNVRVIKKVPPLEMSELIREGGPNALFENINTSQFFDQMIPEYHSLMKLFRDLIMENSKSPGVPVEHKRLMDLEIFFDFHLFSFIKFFDHTHNDEHDANYYLEREWRVVGNVQFAIEDIETIFIPKKYSSVFRRELPEYESQLLFVSS